MATNHTKHLGLSQWEPDDEVLRADFNADNAKLDAAAEALSGLPGYCGNCIVVAGTYTGTGSAGSGNPCRLTFPYRPMLVLLEEPYLLRRGVTTATVPSGTQVRRLSVSWTSLGVSWYEVSSSAADQCNASGKLYHYVAFLEREVDANARGTFSA